MQTELEPLSRRYDVVVANPPYMGSSSLGKWMGSWVKKHWPEAYRDLCTCFIDRGFGMSSDSGYSAMVTMQSWMFLGSFEKLRGKILRNHSISSMAHLGTRAFGAIGGEVVSTAATVFANAKCEVKGAYFRLVDMGSEEEKQAGLLEALANPDCGWFYRADASQFEVISGTPITYWASKKMLDAFAEGEPFRNYANLRVGMQTGDNERFLRLWWEVSAVGTSTSCKTQDEFSTSQARWVGYNKGGQFRKWYGNLDYVLNWWKEGQAIKTLKNGERRSFSILPTLYRFKESITWTDITSSVSHFRFRPAGSLYDIKGMSCFPPANQQLYVLGFCNSIVATTMLKMLSPTMNTQVGDVGKLPIIQADSTTDIKVSGLVKESIGCAAEDWNAFEVSWDFERHPLL